MKRDHFECVDTIIDTSDKSEVLIPSNRGAYERFAKNPLWRSKEAKDDVKS